MATHSSSPAAIFALFSLALIEIALVTEPTSPREWGAPEEAPRVPLAIGSRPLQSRKLPRAPLGQWVVGPMMCTHMERRANHSALPKPEELEYIDLATRRPGCLAPD